MLSRCSKILLACLTICVFSGSASAAIISYNFAICENLNVLLNPDSISAQQQAVQTTVQSLIVARDMPYFKLTNTSMDPTAVLTSFRLTIPANRPNDFDYVNLISVSPGITLTINQPDTINDGLHSKFIDITFSGFTKDKSVIFRADIDWTTGDPNFQTDYRTALFNVNNSDPTSNNNALLDVAFNNDPALSDSRPLPNFASDGTVYTCVCYRNPAQVDHVMAYELGQIQVIPEPGPIAAGIALLIGGWWWRRQMRQLIQP
jgi:hypothetical protein